jgi:thymidine kinase
LWLRRRSGHGAFAARAAPAPRLKPGRAGYTGMDATGAPGSAPAPAFGSIELIIGPMFSGKTTELVRRVRREALAGAPALVIKWADDNRYEEGSVIAAHSEIRQGSAPGSEQCAAIRVVMARRLADVGGVGAGGTVIGVDEGQFYPDLLAQCELWARNGNRVIVAALDGDFARRPFGEVCELVPRCEAVVKLDSVCSACRRTAAFTQRTTVGTAIVLEGGRESYRAVCRACHAAGTS